MPPKARRPRKRPEDLDDERTPTWKYIAFLVLLCGGALQVMLPLFEQIADAFASSGYTEFDIDSPELSKVFFSGDPWLILCKSKSEKKIAKEWQYTAQAYRADYHPELMNLGVMACEQTLPSGKTVYDRFKLKAPETNVYVPKPPPHAFMVANGRKPVMIPQKFFSYRNPDAQVGQQILDYAKKFTKPASSVAASNADLNKKCLKQGVCAVILSRGKLNEKNQDILNQLILSHRNVNFVRINTLKKKFSLESKLPKIPDLLDDENEAEPRLIFIKKVKGEKQWKVRAFKKLFKFSDVDHFLDEHLAATGEEEDKLLVTLNKKPTIAARPKNAGKKKSKSTRTAKKTKKAPKAKADKKAKAKAGDKKSQTHQQNEAAQRAKDDVDQKQRERRARDKMEEDARNSYNYVEEAEKDEEVELEDDELDEEIILEDDGEDVEAEDDDVPDI